MCRTSTLLAELEDDDELPEPDDEMDDNEDDLKDDEEYDDVMVCVPRCRWVLINTVSYENVPKLLNPNPISILTRTLIFLKSDFGSFR